eukprot:GHVT01020081.1.p1 GENE.GHVT01020081.1~~GHVT01020081.1.p1  ORF type:complete len:107 (-),score=6.47 GHVT01020081.1:755-1075(-)
MRVTLPSFVLGKPAGGGEEGGRRERMSDRREEDSKYIFQQNRKVKLCNYKEDLLKKRAISTGSFLHEFGNLFCVSRRLSFDGCRDGRGTPSLRGCRSPGRGSRRTP